MGFIKTETGENLIWYLTEEDIQTIAKRILDRKLTEKELKKIQNDLEPAFEYWEAVVENGIIMVGVGLKSRGM